MQQVSRQQVLEFVESLGFTPEQTRGQVKDVRIDPVSISVTLYEVDERGRHVLSADGTDALVYVVPVKIMDEAVAA